jgi:glycosyltransferase involved in cell wall biosynthesis
MKQQIELRIPSEISQSMHRFRVLQVFGTMNRGGAETWLMHVMRNIDRKRFQIDFLVHRVAKGSYDDEIRALGSQVIPCPGFKNPLSYSLRLRGLLKEHGPYDVVHSHVHHFSGLILRVAKGVGVPVRICHAHSDTRMVDSRAGLLRRAYLGTLKRWLKSYASEGMAASENAAVALWGTDWRLDSRWRIMHCAIDPGAFREAGDKSRLRANIGLPPEAIVIGHVGRFDPPKNHTFVLQIFKAALEMDSRVRLLLVGDGPLRDSVTRGAKELGLSDRVLITGSRDDVPQVMKEAMDVFVFPSLYEGLPLVVLEAQAAGLPVVLSEQITREVAVSPSLLTWAPLSKPAEEWAKMCLTAAREGNLASREKAWGHIVGSGFDIANSVGKLQAVYSGTRYDA